jgi:hypothetical protein
MANWLYSASTLFGILMIGGSLALQILYIKNNQQSDDYFPHQVASVVMDTLVVCYLMATLIYFRPYASPVETGVAVILLMVGLGLEIFSTQWNLTTATTWGGYLLTASNSLIRLFILVQTRCESPRSTVPDLIREVVKVAKDTGKPATEVLKQVGEPLGTIDPSNIYGKISSLLGPELSGLAPEKIANIKDAIKRGVGLQPKEPRGGRR